MTELIGYIALLLNLLSMSRKKVRQLRLLSLIANALYIAYGFLLDAWPLMLGCSVAVLIHAWYLRVDYTIPR